MKKTKLVKLCTIKLPTKQAAACNVREEIEKRSWVNCLTQGNSKGDFHAYGIAIDGAAISEVRLSEVDGICERDVNVTEAAAILAEMTEAERQHGLENQFSIEAVRDFWRVVATGTLPLDSGDMGGLAAGAVRRGIPLHKAAQEFASEMAFHDAINDWS